MKKYRVIVGNRTFSEVDCINDALTVFRKLDKAGFHPVIMDRFGIVKD